MKIHMIALISYALIIAPGCKPRGVDSSTKEDGKTQKNAQVLNDSVQKFGLGDTYEDLLKSTKEMSGDFEIFGVEEDQSLTLIPSSAFVESTIDNPVVSKKSGQTFSSFYFQGKANKKEAFGMETRLATDKNSLKIKVYDITMKTQAALSQYSNTSMKQFIKAYHTILIDFTESSKEAVRSRIISQTQGLKSFLTKMAAKFQSPNQSGYQLAEHTPVKMLKFFMGTVVISMVASVGIFLIASTEYEMAFGEFLGMGAFIFVFVGVIAMAIYIYQLDNNQSLFKWDYGEQLSSSN